MFRFTIRDVLWLTVVVGLAVALWLEHSQVMALRETLNEQDAKRRIMELRERELRGGAIITPAPMIATPRLDRLDEPRRAKDE
jgi:hypothetical protein